MAILPIRIYPDPILRTQCQEVESFDEELATLVENMVETMHDAPGVGLAAPQVGIDRRLAVVDLSVGEDPEALLVMVNPRLVDKEGEWTETEGCLSMPGITDKVVRPERIVIHAQEVTGEEFELEAEEWLARAILHEMDHLDGVLFVDYLKGFRKDRAKRALKRLAAEREEALV